ncbi:MAG: MFS transporter [Ascidiaceihabitans sp.]|nr:MFS transporter [Ascidiaceihabitans sp.]
MRTGLILLALAYVLSQFFRAFLAVISVPLERDLGIGPEALAAASGWWFISFAAMQIPVGWSLDTLGPKRTASVLLLIGGAGGSLLFALAGTAMHINIAMILIGIGCSPVLMASFYIFAREFAPMQFATLAATMVGVGTVGNLLASYPMTFAEATIGWRATMIGLAVLCTLIAIGVQITVRDPAKVVTETKGSLIDILRIPAVWLIAPIAIVGYVPAAAIRGSWMGPYLNDVHGLSSAQIGTAAVVMSLSMIGGVFLYGPLDRWLGTRKWVVFGGNVLGLGCLIGLYAYGASSIVLAVVLMCGIGFFGATYPVIMAHGKGLFPAHLTGRGVTLLNMFSIGGVGLAQFVARPLHASYQGTDQLTPYTAVFAFFIALMIVGLALYLFSRDNKD